MTEPSDEFIRAVLGDSSSVDLDVDGAYAGVTRRVQYVKRRRLALVSGAACVALLGGVVFAGSLMGVRDDVQPGGPATDLRGNLIPDSDTVTTSTVEPPIVVLTPPDATPTSTEPNETVFVPGTSSQGSADGSADDDAPNTTADDGHHGTDGPDTTSDGSGGSHNDGSGGSDGGSGDGSGGEGEGYDGGRDDGGGG